MNRVKLFILVSVILGSNVACSHNQNSPSETNQQNIQESLDTELSSTDKKIVEKYENIVKESRSLVVEESTIKLKSFLSEVSKIKDKKTREKIQMQIYLATNMYQEAYKLNNKMLNDSFSEARLVTQCELSYYAKRSKEEYEACYAKLASAFEKELKNTPKTDPEYIYGEWGYLLAMYKSGHKEYESKLNEMLKSIEDEQLKFQFESSYELAKEQVESYN